MRLIILIGILVLVLVSGCNVESLEADCEGMIPESCTCYLVKDGKMCMGNATQEIDLELKD